MSKNDYNKILNAIYKGSRAGDRINFGPVQDIDIFDFVGSDFNYASLLSVRSNGFVMGHSMWGNDEEKVV